MGQLRQLCTARSPLYAARDSVYQISMRLRQLCTACSHFYIQLVNRSIRSVAPAVYSSLASLYSSRLGPSDQLRQLCTARSPLYTARDSVYQISAGLRQPCTARCFGVGPANGLRPALCPPHVQRSSDGAVNRRSEK